MQDHFALFLFDALPVGVRGALGFLQILDLHALGLRGEARFLHSVLSGDLDGRTGVARVVVPQFLG